jgi:hypothetical protein
MSYIQHLTFDQRIRFLNEWMALAGRPFQAETYTGVQS